MQDVNFSSEKLMVVKFENQNGSKGAKIDVYTTVEFIYFILFFFFLRATKGKVKST